MPLVQAWQCPRSKKLFADKEEYLAHLRKEAGISRRQKRVARIAENLDQSFGQMRRLGTFEAISRWLETNAEVIYVHTLVAAGVPLDKIDPTGFKITEAVFYGVRRTSNVAATHFAPIGHLPRWDWRTNDGCRFDAHQGNLRIYYELPPKQDRHNSHMFGMQCFRNTGINYGCGNGGGGRSGQPEFYDVQFTMFDLDWPNMIIEMMLKGEIEPNVH